MDGLAPEPGAVLRRQLLEREAEDLLDGRGRVRADIVHGDRSIELARDRREGRVLEPAGRDPLGEGRGVEIDVERVAVRGHPAGDVHADGADLARRRVEPDAGEAFDPRRLEVEGADRADDRLFQVADVALDVAAVPVEVEDRVADELPRSVEGGLAAAVGLDDLDVGVGGDVQLGALVGAPARA